MSDGLHVCTSVFLVDSQDPTTPVMSAVDDWVGVSYETGGVVFDPLGLAELHSVAPLVQPHPKVWNSTLEAPSE